MTKLSRLSALLLLILVLSSPLFSQQADSIVNRVNTITIEQILDLPEKQIDIGLADLVLAKDFYPDLNIESFLFTFGYMADRFNYFFGQHTDPDKRIRALNTFLYKKGEWNDSIIFKYDDDDLRVSRLSNKFINGYLSTKKGSCITLPMMYVVLAERLGFPIYVTRLPYHFFVRYVPEKKIPGFQQNIEATNGGGYASDREYKQNFFVADKPVKNGVYLRTLSKKQYLASLLLINANEWIARKDLEKAKHYLELSMTYDSTFTSAIMNYALIHLQEAIGLERRMSDEKQSEIAHFDIRAKNKAHSQEPPSPGVSGASQQRFAVREGDSSAFQSPIERIIPEMKNSKRSQSIPPARPAVQVAIDPDLQMSLSEITHRYAPLIEAKVAVYEKYRQRAEAIGIVREFPMSFFQMSSKSLKQFQENGVK